MRLLGNPKCFELSAFESKAFFSLNFTTKFRWNFLKNDLTGLSKNLHASSTQSLLSESVKMWNESPQEIWAWLVQMFWRLMETRGCARRCPWNVCYASSRSVVWVCEIFLFFWKVLFSNVTRGRSVQVFFLEDIGNKNLFSTDCFLYTAQTQQSRMFFIYSFFIIFIGLRLFVI